MTRTKLLQVRCTETDKQRWILEAKAAGVTVSELVRQRMNKKQRGAVT